MPWLKKGRERYYLWDLPLVDGVSDTGAVLYPVLVMTTLVGVAASAAATRPAAVAACATGVVANVLIAVFIADPGSGFETRPGAGLGREIAFGYAIVFLFIAVATPGGRRGPSRRPRQAVGPSESWMDASFGTMDKRYFGRR